MPKPTIPRSRLTAVLLAGLAIGAIGGASGAAAIDGEQRSPWAIPAPAAAAAQPARSFGSLADMVEDVGDSVVQIKAKPQAAQGQALMLDMFGNPGTAPRGHGGGGSQGSGFVIDEAGLIVTNNHVVARGGALSVTLSDGTELPARLVGRDEKTDLAVIRVDAGRPLKPVRWGDSDAARVGESVFAVGSPFGLGNTVTAGIISARGREIGAGPYDDFLQVDASINSGNSGGPLFDGAGRVLGVNTAIFSPSGGNVGIGFAIPARLAQSVVGQLVEKGSVSRGRIGVGLQMLTPDVAGALGLEEAKGALIASVDPGGPAATAGLRSGDVVVAVDRRSIEDARDFARAIAEAPIGSRPALSVRRAGQRLALGVTIARTDEQMG
jgi:serine protease Do